MNLKCYYYYLLKAYGPVNHTGSPQGFSLNQILHMLKCKCPFPKTGALTSTYFVSHSKTSTTRQKETETC